MAVNCVFCQVGVPERNTDLTKNIESPDILHNGHRYRHDPFLPEHRPAATGRIQFELQLGNIQAAAPMPLTSPGNDDDTGENHQPTLRKNTAEPAQQTLKQYTLVKALVADPHRRVAGVLGLQPSLDQFRAPPLRSESSTQARSRSESMRRGLRDPRRRRSAFLCAASAE